MSTLLADVHGCHECDATVYGFERAPDREGYLKFPATIGAVGPATLLFVGINPYRTVRNELLYEEAMASLDAFGTLAGNREPHPGSTSTPYIRRHIPGERRRYGREPFYDQYMEVIKGVWEEDTAFEEHAVATELYLCSTVGIGNRAFVSASLCAARFFARTFAQVLPKAVITVGAPARDYMREEHALEPVDDATLSPYWARVGGHDAWVFDIPHNGAFVTEGVRPRALQHVVDGLINIVHRRLDPEQRPLSELFPQTSRRSRASSADVTAARERLAAGEAFSDEQVYEIYAPQRPQYRAYLAAWKIRQALGYDKSDVRIETESVGRGYRFRIVPKRQI